MQITGNKFPPGLKPNISFLLSCGTAEQAAEKGPNPEQTLD
jgi:hypothetical protein